MDNKIINCIILVVVFALAILLYVKREAVMSYFNTSPAVTMQSAPKVLVGEEVDVEMEDADADQE